MKLDMKKAKWVTLDGKSTESKKMIKRLDVVLTLMKENRRLRRALRKYGMHVERCNASWEVIVGPPNKCTCGLAKALKPR